VVGVEEFDEGVPRLYVYDSNGRNRKLIAGPYVSAFFAWSPDSKSIVYSKNRIARNGSRVNDLFFVNVETKETQSLTYSERATDPDWSADGTKIVYCIHQGSLSNLAIYDLNSHSSTLLTSFEKWTEVFSPQWSADGSQVVFSLFDGDGKRDIAIVNADGSGFTKITDDFIDDRYPAWSSDRGKIAYTSYRDGIPNLFLKDIKSGNVKQISDVPGGVYKPCFHPVENKIAVIVFENRSKISAYCIDLTKKNLNVEKTAAYQEIDWHRVRPGNFVELHIKGDSTSQDLKRSNYHSILNVRSQLSAPFFGYDDRGLQLGVLNLLADPLGKHQFLCSVTHRKRTHFSINYTNTQYLPVIQLAYYNTTLDKGNYITVNHQNMGLWEKLRNASLTFSIPFNFGQSLLSNHLLWIQGNVSKRQTIDAEKFEILRPKYPQLIPFQGWTNFLTVGYSWSCYRPDVGYDIHPKTGATFSAYYRLSDKKFYSDLQFDELGSGLILRKELSIKEHVVTAHLSSVFHWGDQPVQNRMALGISNIRGLGNSVEGDKIVMGNFEYRWSLLRDLGLQLWVFYFERFCGALFYDVGKAWGTNLDTYLNGGKRDFNETDWVSTTGIMLRHRFYILGKVPLILKAGYGIILPDAEAGNLFFSIESIYL